LEPTIFVPSEAVERRSPQGHFSGGRGAGWLDPGACGLTGSLQQSQQELVEIGVLNSVPCSRTSTRIMQHHPCGSARSMPQVSARARNQKHRMFVSPTGRNKAYSTTLALRKSTRALTWPLRQPLRSLPGCVIFVGLADQTLCASVRHTSDTRPTHRRALSSMSPARNIRSSTDMLDKAANLATAAVTS
jgi:hypothetical protein